MTPEEIHELAVDIVKEKVWILSGRDELVTTCFPILLMAKPEQIPPTAVSVYEYISKAGPLAVNGMPMFFSCHFVLEEDLDALRSEVQRLEEALA